MEDAGRVARSARRRARRHPSSARDLRAAPYPKRSGRLTTARPRSRAQVYPIFAAIGGAVGLCGFFCTRQLVASPGFTAAKSRRMAGILETKADFDEGKNWRDHRVRRFLRSMYGGKGHGPQIFPGLNESFGGGQH